MPKAKSDRKAGNGSIKQRALATRGQPSAFESAAIARKRHNVIGATATAAPRRARRRRRALGRIRFAARLS